MNTPTATQRDIRSFDPMTFFQQILRISLTTLALTLSGSTAHAADDHDHDHDHDQEKKGTVESAPHLHAEEAEHHDEVTISPEAAQLYGVTIATAKKQRLADFVTVPARVALNADRMAHIGSSVEGRIAELPVRIGDTVKRGDVVAVINSPALGEAQGDFLQKKSGLAFARTAVEVAQKSFERGRDLEPGKGISISEFQKREGEFRLAEAALVAAESAAVTAKNKLHILGVSAAQIDTLSNSNEVSTRLEIHAPIDGEVIEREVTLGEVVGPDRESLMVLADLSTMWILADVSERDAARIVKGSSATVTFASLPGLSFTGPVAYIAPVLDTHTRKATARVEITPSTTRSSHEAPPSYTAEEVAQFKADNNWCAEHEKPESHCPECNPSLAKHAHDSPPLAQGTVLRAGMFGEALLTLAPSPGQSSLTLVSVPVGAIQTVEGGPAVFVPVENEPNTFAKRAITIGPRMGRIVPVLSGLKDGESFVATGSFILKAEMGKAGAAHEH